MTVTLPDGSRLELPDGATGHDAAAAIGPGLAKAAVAVRVGDDIRDLAQCHTDHSKKAQGQPASMGPQMWAHPAEEPPERARLGGTQTGSVPLAGPAGLACRA